MRRRQEKNEQLSLAELEQYREKVRALDMGQLEIEYKALHNAARMPERLPSPRLIQEFVQCWRELRRRRKLMIYRY